ncbi:stage II sporulation protein P [Effusibacillus consociatus]|uniref:Stage II sporulation protein P n=1 Tax=Effusibacillus consociatus TaxID=1117041 RepID=A0ABV9Q0Q9_9BACL
MKNVLNLNSLKIDNKLRKMYPGLSRGVHKKIPNPAYDTRYNQDLFPNSIIIEVGGPENTLKETFYTADMLANVIAEVAKDEEKSSK